MIKTKYRFGEGRRDGGFESLSHRREPQPPAGALATGGSLSHRREPQPPAGASATGGSLSHRREPQPPAGASATVNGKSYPLPEALEGSSEPD